MSDNLKLRAPVDSSLISLKEPWEVKYWTNKFGVTEAQLKAAVTAVGNSAAKVKVKLGK